jgi:prepilin-type N-terminal cleavage/methylation domain-containing protein
MSARRTQGFTLVEVAIAVAIVSLMMVGAIYTLNAQMDQRAYEETRNRLNHARELLLAYAVVNGRLPCPARSNSSGIEVRNSATGECKNTAGTVVEDHYGGNLGGGVTGGFLPAATLGYGHVDANGFALDGWNNPIRYAVAKTLLATGCPTPTNLPHFVHAANLKANGIACQPGDLVICKSSLGITASSCGAGSNSLVTQNLVAAILFSTGKTGASGPRPGDEAANINTAGANDPVFVFHTPTPTFDDQYTWITAGEVYGRLVAAGLLPY